MKEILSKICPWLSSHSFSLRYQQSFVTGWVFAAHTICEFLWSKMHLSGVFFIVENLKSNIFSDQHFCQLEAEFLSLQCIILHDMSEEASRSKTVTRSKNTTRNIPNRCKQEHTLKLCLFYIYLRCCKGAYKTV